MSHITKSRESVAKLLHHCCSGVLLLLGLAIVPAYAVETVPIEGVPCDPGNSNEVIRYDVQVSANPQKFALGERYDNAIVVQVHKVCAELDDPSWSLTSDTLVKDDEFKVAVRVRGKARLIPASPSSEGDDASEVVNGDSESASKDDDDVMTSKDSSKPKATKFLSSTLGDDGLLTFGLDLTELDYEGSTGSFQLEIRLLDGATELLRQAHLETIELDTSGDLGVYSDLVATELFLGSTFGLKYDEEGQTDGFGDAEAVVRLNYDYLMGVGKPWAVHLSTRLTSTSFVSQLQDNPSDGGDTSPGDGSATIGVSEVAKVDGDGEVEEAPESNIEPIDAYSASFTVLVQPKWRLFAKPESLNTSGDFDRPYDSIRSGLFTRVGFVSRSSRDLNGDNTLLFYNIGYSLNHYQTRDRWKKDETENSFPISFLEVSYGWYEEFGDKRKSDRLVVDAGLRLASTGGGAVPFYAGVHLNAGEGPDDHRIFAGFLFRLDRLTRLLGN